MDIKTSTPQKAVFRKKQRLKIDFLDVVGPSDTYRFSDSRFFRCRCRRDAVTGISGEQALFLEWHFNLKVAAGLGGVDGGDNVGRDQLHHRPLGIF